MGNAADANQPVTDTTAAPRASLLGRTRRHVDGFDWRSYVIYFTFGTLCVVFAITLRNDGFLSWQTPRNVLEQTAQISIMAVAMTFVIGSAEIDLSVGRVAGLASVTSAMAVSHWGVWAGIGVGLATGLTVGIMNGALVTLFRIPSFLVTLGMSLVALGTAMWITATESQPVLDQGFTRPLGGGHILGVQALIFWTAIVTAVGAVVLRKTAYGRHVLATGGNRTAAEFTGVNTRRIKFSVLVVSSVAAAFAGMLYAGVGQTGRFDTGAGNELTVIAAVILGGTSLFGGKATVIGSLIGSLMIGMINYGLNLGGLDSSQQFVVQGIIIVVAVALGRRK
jgi:ribose transport system permease protein